MDLDPLNAFTYPPFNNYDTTPNMISESYPSHDVKMEPQNTKIPDQNVAQQLEFQCNGISDNSKLDEYQEVDRKPNIEMLGVNPNETRKTVIIKEGGKKRRKIIRYEYHIVKRVKKDKNPKVRKNCEPKKPKERSTYWSEKITDPNFNFYSCAICDVNYKTLNELDLHVGMQHKNRVTSYDLRIQKELKKKELRREKKKLKKSSAIVKLELPEIEIKPEGGYIGTKPASEYNEGEDSKYNDSIDFALAQNNENYPINNTINNETVNGNTDNGNLESVSVNPVSTSSDNENVVKNTKSDIVDDDKSMPCNGEYRTIDLHTITNSEKFKNLEKIYKCHACKKQFMLSYYLKLHVRSHTDEKPYTCNECGQKFITASKLGRHKKRIHQTARHQCRICFKAFSKFEPLMKHFDKTHPDDKLEGEPYDYSVILPYLKDLEEQLSRGAVGEVTEVNPLATASTTADTFVEDKKPKSEDIWVDTLETPKIEDDEKPKDIPVPHFICPPSPDDNKDFKKDLDMDDTLFPTQHLVIEENRLPEEEVKIKKEQIDDQNNSDDNDGHHSANEAPVSDGGVKDEQSEEEFFPANTWVTSPKPEPSRVSPVPPKTKRKKNDPPIKCPECDKTINSLSYYRVHMRTHTGEKPFRCYICNRGFITSSKMHRHVLTHNESWQDGDKKPEDGSPPVKKEDKEDDKKNSESLKKAKAKFAKKKKGAPSANRCQKRPHACEFCQKKFLHKETLQVHKKSHEGEPASKQCNFCLITVAEGEVLADHEATHTGPKPFLCTVCGKTYKRRETMVYHKKQHKPEKTYICDICSKLFNSASKLQRHIVGHSVDKFILRYECPVCAHMFNTKYHIQMHLSTHQKEGLIMEENRNDILAMVLQNARKIPKSAEAPPNMSDLIPADERSRVCNICGEMFHHFYYLEEHLKSHGSKIAVEDVAKEEERKHICPVCKKGFKLHYYLKLHSFTHTKEKPFICQQCGKGFITKGKLKRHLETHTGLKKYQCHICYKFFTRPSYLRIHVRTIHGTQDYNFRMNREFEMSPFNLSNYSSNVSVVSENSV